MIEDIGLNPLVMNPSDVGYENVYLDRQALFRRSQLPNQKSHALLVNRRMGPEVLDAIGAESTRVGQVSSIEQGSRQSVFLNLQAFLTDFRALFRKVPFEKVDFFEFRDFAFREETNAGKIQILGYRMAS